MWLTGGADRPVRDGSAVPIRTILGAPARPGRMTRTVRIGARWGVWVLALGGTVVGGYGVWHLLYGDRVEGEVSLGRQPAPFATTSTSTTTTTTTTTTTVPPTTVASSTVTVASVDAGPRATADDRGGPSGSDAAAGGAGVTPTVTTVDDHGGRSVNSGKGSTDSGSGSSGSGSGSSGSGSSGSGRDGSGHD
jgi:hypothetical protein